MSRIDSCFNVLTKNWTRSIRGTGSALQFLHKEDGSKRTPRRGAGALPEYGPAERLTNSVTEPLASLRALAVGAPVPLRGRSGCTSLIVGYSSGFQVSNR